MLYSRGQQRIDFPAMAPLKRSQDEDDNKSFMRLFTGGTVGEFLPSGGG